MVFRGLRIGIGFQISGDLSLMLFSFDEEKRLLVLVRSYILPNDSVSVSSSVQLGGIQRAVAFGSLREEKRVVK